MSCIFCKIVAGELPSYKIYEDAIFVAILNRFPATKGSVLLIPKEHVENTFELSDETLRKILPLAKKIAEKIFDALNCDGINFLQNNGKAAGQEIFHYHLHIIPRFEEDNVKISCPPTDPSPAEFEKIQTLLQLRAEKIN
ncbi:MAG: HIT family protein [Defluviitaleaceae bacterium]|nr:HIT family protein [Defluviitaleaceae bacterium]